MGWKSFWKALRGRKDRDPRRKALGFQPQVQTLEVRELLDASGPSLLVDFREITYFHDTQVLTSSDPLIRANNGIAGAFDPGLWPGPGGSKGTEFRLYGFAPFTVGWSVENADNPSTTYAVQADAAIPGAYYVDLGGPARTNVPVSWLQNGLLDGSSA